MDLNARSPCGGRRVRTAGTSADRGFRAGRHGGDIAARHQGDLAGPSSRTSLCQIGLLEATGPWGEPIIEFVPDSPLEGGVYCELVTEVGLPAPGE